MTMIKILGGAIAAIFCFATEGMAGMVQPIGIAVVGGLTSSTFVTLLVIPVLYSIVMKNQKNTSRSKIKIEYTE